MDKVEAMIEAGGALPPVQRERLAPWWGWFALIIILAILGAPAIY